MKTIFTNSSFRTFFLTFAVALWTLSLAGQTKHVVSVVDYRFDPAEINISVGDTVEWVHDGNEPHNVNGNKATFATNPESFFHEVGLDWTYEYVFKTAGTYNYQCDPHAANMKGTVVVNPAAAEDTLTLTVNFTSMNPHVGQALWLAVIDTTTGIEIGRVKHQVATADFSLEVTGMEMGKSYNVDFWADLNKNGVYNAPPVDHAWRLTLNDVKGDTTLAFVHNTNDLIDIDWKTKLSVHFIDFGPHVGQMITIYVRDSVATLDTVVCTAIRNPEFYESSFVIEPTKSYTIDIWADFDEDSTYDAPPVDHAWRLQLNNVVSDTIIDLVHNIKFFDIAIPTAIEELDGKVANLRLYPNPASQYIELLIPASYKRINSMKVYSVTGTLVGQKVFSGNVESLRYDVSGLKNGAYFVEINSGTQRDILKFLKQ